MLIIEGLLGGLGAVRSVLIGASGGISVETLEGTWCAVGGVREVAVLDPVRGLGPCRMTR